MSLWNEMEPSDKTLVDKARAGDAEAFEQLFGRYTRMLASYVRRWVPTSVRRKVSITDILQETRIVAFERLADFELRDEKSLRNWFLKIVELKVRERLRHYAGTAKRAVAREVTRAQRPETAQFRAGGPSPSQVAIAAELAELAERVLRQLPLDYQEVLRLVREEECTLAEAGRRMGRSCDAAKKLYGRALSADRRSIRTT
jgi:RNA polymerase sigma-70 factor (ECF subfamily)